MMITKETDKKNGSTYYVAEHRTIGGRLFIAEGWTFAEASNSCAHMLFEFTYGTNLGPNNNNIKRVK